MCASRASRSGSWSAAEGEAADHDRGRTLRLHAGNCRIDLAEAGKKCLVVVPVLRPAHLRNVDDIARLAQILGRVVEIARHRQRAVQEDDPDLRGGNRQRLRRERGRDHRQGAGKPSRGLSHSSHERCAVIPRKSHLSAPRNPQSGGPLHRIAADRDPAARPIASCAPYYRAARRQRRTSPQVAAFPIAVTRHLDAVTPPGVVRAGRSDQGRPVCQPSTMAGNGSWLNNPSNPTDGSQSFPDRPKTGAPEVTTEPATRAASRRYPPRAWFSRARPHAGRREHIACRRR